MYDVYYTNLIVTLSTFIWLQIRLLARFNSILSPYWKLNFPMSLSFRRSVGWLDGLWWFPISEREASLPSSYKITCSFSHTLVDVANDQTIWMNETYYLQAHSSREFVIVENIRQVCLIDLTADFVVKTCARLTPDCQLRRREQNWHSGLPVHSN